VLLDDTKGVKLDFFFEPSTSFTLYGKQHRYVGPVAWLAPETIETKQHTKASDAFSFGVYLWELVAKDDPYADRNVITVACPVIHKGLRLQIPDNSPAPFAELMKSCFDENPENRPTFDTMAKQLKTYYESL
jgi:serine/threonine protein kinase